MKMLIRISVYAILFGLSLAAYAQGEGAQARGPESLFYRGNAFYEKGEYAKAIEEYNAMLEKGLEGGALYYNLGNAYCKIGDLGRAILYYEKAMELMPQDADLKSNLDYARSLVEEPSGFAERRLWVRLLENLTVSLNLEDLALVLSGGYCLLAVLAALALLLREKIGTRLSALAIFVGAVLLVGASSFAVRFYEKEVLRPAIVIAKEEDARFEPLDQSTVYYKVRAGSKVFVLASKEGWSKIRRLDNKAAWIKTDAIALI